MTTIEDHTRWVNDHWRDKAAARALIDRLQEEKGYSWWEAARIVAYYRCDNRHAHALALAARMNRRESKVRNLVRHLCAVAVQMPDGVPFTIMLTSTFNPPQLCGSTVLDIEYVGDRDWIVVGARWVIRHVRQFLQTDSRLKLWLAKGKTEWQFITEAPNKVKTRRKTPKTN